MPIHFNSYNFIPFKKGTLPKDWSRLRYFFRDKINATDGKRKIKIRLDIIKPAGVIGYNSVDYGSRFWLYPAEDFDLSEVFRTIEEYVAIDCHVFVNWRWVDDKS